MSASGATLPIVLVCNHLHAREIIRRNGITRYAPLYRTTESALEDLPATHKYCHRVRAELPALPASHERARGLTSQW
jgi:hypothetical protein